MATVDETIVTGRKYRLYDKVNNIWKRVSYWTHASDVGLDDGRNAADVLSMLEEEIGFKGTMAEIEAAIEAGIISDGMLVFCTDDEITESLMASSIGYDNTISKYDAEEVQAVIDEVIEKKVEKYEDSENNIKGVDFLGFNPLTNELHLPVDGADTDIPFKKMLSGTLTVVGSLGVGCGDTGNIYSYSWKYSTVTITVILEDGVVKSQTVSGGYAWTGNIGADVSTSINGAATFTLSSVTWQPAE